MKNLEWKFKKVISGTSKEKGVNYLQVYFTLFYEDKQIHEGFFWVNGEERIQWWEENFSDILVSKKQNDIDELEAKLKSLKGQ